MLIPTIDNIRYLNLHVLWLKVEWIDLTFMPCEYFGTSPKTSNNWSVFFYDIVVCPSSHHIRRLDSTQWIMMMCARAGIFSLCVTETVLIWLEVIAKNDKMSVFM
jgi:hypothetical protein